MKEPASLAEALPGLDGFQILWVYETPGERVIRSKPRALPLAGRRVA